MCTGYTNTRTQQRRTAHSWFKIFLHFRIIFCSPSQKLKKSTIFLDLSFSILVFSSSLLYKFGVPTPFLEPQSRVSVYSFGISTFGEAVWSSEYVSWYLCYYKNGSANLSAAVRTSFPTDRADVTPQILGTVTFQIACRSERKWNRWQARKEWLCSVVCWDLSLSWGL